MEVDKHKLKEQLREQFNLESFRPGQAEIIKDALSGNDVLGILPTGSGKSLCYQLPATFPGGMTIVVSPLISLMEDQVRQLKATGFKAVAALNSFMNVPKKKRVLRELNQFKLIYLSPELLQYDEIFQRLKQISIRLFVIDEAHCISQWGHEFRPDYLRLGTVLKSLGNPAVMALSATATPEVQDDIIKSLNRPAMKKHIYPMDRDNITFTVKEVNSDKEKQNILVSLLKRYRVPTLIYFSSKRKTEETAALLTEHVPSHRIAFYHGDMDQMDRITIQQQFMNDQLDVICCTSAFGMGINKHNIRLIVHFHFPLQIESYIQEIGRAGRDGKSSVSLLLYSPADKVIPNSIIENELPGQEALYSIAGKLKQLDALPPMEELLPMLELNEIQWRFLRYQMEEHGMIRNNTIVYHQDHWKHTLSEISKFIDKRSSLKIRKLYEVTSWIQTDNCLRQKLYKGFQSTLKPPLFACCSNCGFSFTNWTPEQTKESQPVPSWELKLKNIFLPGDEYAETE
ncbi:ATP-dependent DNA helicase RecQ [Lentibacillus cibarius]|uniref:ATP-dependent DNA helicase RecQ n=1 Tax=Lentibacillus cibarius TaxID=2583219 RepID=A0A549YL42_9BACI|nr:ATP-dependent DNA helicase RecQ [Lentibacillus cibarius]TRM12598.1 ATP-dependent DNA helicase RecQ [Lentibacillus cibarius]